jgi:hypothetical protein
MLIKQALVKNICEKTAAKWMRRWVASNLAQGLPTPTVSRAAQVMDEAHNYLGHIPKVRDLRAMGEGSYYTNARLGQKFRRAKGPRRGDFRDPRANPGNFLSIAMDLETKAGKNQAQARNALGDLARIFKYKSGQLPGPIRSRAFDLNARAGGLGQDNPEVAHYMRVLGLGA